MAIKIHVQSEEKTVLSLDCSSMILRGFLLPIVTCYREFYWDCRLFTCTDLPPINNYTLESWEDCSTNSSPLTSLGSHRGLATSSGSQCLSSWTDRGLMVIKGPSRLGIHVNVLVTHKCTIHMRKRLHIQSHMQRDMNMHISTYVVP